MDPLVVWLVIGIPALVLAAALFLRPSYWRALAGYVVLGLAFALTAAFHRPSAAVFGGLIALLVAAGRGTAVERADVHPDEEGVPDEALHPRRRRPPQVA